MRRTTSQRRTVIRNVTVLGAGGWGTALAVHLARVGHEAHLWARDAALAADVQQRRFNPVYLPEIRFPANLRVTADLGDALNGSDLVIAAVPSHGTREVLRKAAPHIRRGATVVSATKGLEGNTLFRMSEVVEQECAPGTRVAVLSGPSFAIELARELPTAVSIASRDPEVVERVQAEFRAPYFRLYGTDDVVGVEIGGALKNIIAIAAGVVEGLGLGHNALAASDHARPGRDVASRLRGRRQARNTLGPDRPWRSGADLHRTPQSQSSRRHGARQGRALQDVLGGMKMVAEGVRTTEAALALAARYGVELPIAAQVAELLAGRKDARTALSELMLRPQRAEVG